jgi:DNA-binding CsgD family transcriptional regulator
MSSRRHAALSNASRLGELIRLRLLDTPPEEQFDRLTRLAARVLGAPVALMSLVDDHRQFFKSAFGLPEPWATRRETPLSHSFCKHVVESAAPLVVEDARRHPLVRANPAISTLNVIGYLGVPMTTAGGATLGSFCVIDFRPRTWTEMDQTTMTDLAACVMREIALRPRCSPATIPEKAISELELTDLIHRALHKALHDEQSGHVADVASYRARLTNRQAEIFDLLMLGLETKEVARKLNISPRTVEVHRAHIIKRLNVSRFSQILRKLLLGLQAP